MGNCVSVAPGLETNDCGSRRMLDVVQGLALQQFFDSTQGKFKTDLG
jgi:hypothetical protein